MKTIYRVHAAWTPFWRKIGSKRLDTPGIVYKSIGTQLALFTTKKACVAWVNDTPGAKKTFGLIPGRVNVTIAYVERAAGKGRRKK